MSNYAMLIQPATASTLIWQKSNDSFFNPVGLNHTGFAADGFWYSGGTQNPNRVASWFSEAPSTTRMGTAFPPQALVLLSRASLTLFDQSEAALNMWMVFYFADDLGLTDNFEAQTIGSLPTGLTWANGVLSVIYTPDAGSPNQNAIALTIDFTQDDIYLEIAQ